MRRSLITAVALALVALAACAPARQAAPQPAVGPESEWDRTLQAAKREGVVSMIGPTGDDRRAALTEQFEQRFGITVEYFGDAGAGIAPKVAAERGAGQYLWDIFVGGTTTGLEAMIPMSAFDPIESSLILDEVKDPQKWRGGELELLDEGRTLLVMTPFHRGTLFINPNLVRSDEIRSYKDLLDSKWRGKLVIDDPRRAGPGQATFSFFFAHPDLGPEFIRALMRQDPAILRDYQQELDGVGQGRYSVLIGGSDALAEARIRQGVPLVIVSPRDLSEGSDVSPASGSVAVFNRAPHPNAAKVYLNWLLSQEAQTIYAKATGYVSSRLDVPVDHTFPWRVPVPGAFKTYDLPAMELKERVVAFMDEVIPR